MAWQPFAVSRRSKVWQDDQNPNKRVVEATIAPIHYESELDSGVADTPVDFSITKVDNAQLDGWIVNAADYHYALGIDKLNHPGEDGWFAFGGRQGAHWFKFRLERVGYLRYNNLAWTGIGGLPTYTRAGNLSQTAKQVELLDGLETINVGFDAEWRNLWATPGGGEAWLEIRADAGRLKVNPVLNQAARDYAATQYPGSGPQQNQYYFGFVFRLDHADIPRTYKQSALQDLGGDFDDDDGSASIEFRDALDRLLGQLPLDDAIVRDPVTGEELDSLRLRKRIYQDGANTYLIVGARVDQLNALPSGDLIFDPTVDAGLSSGDYDASEDSSGTNFDASGTYINATSNLTTPFTAEAVFTITGPASGDTIDVAYTTVKFFNASHDSVNLAIHCEDTDSAVDFVTNADVIDRTLTTESVDWIATDLGTTPVNSPSIVGPVQEVIDRAGWASGNNLGVMFAGKTDSNVSTRIDSYDRSAANSAKLHIEYTAGGGGATVSLNTLSLASSVPALSVTPGAVSTALDTLSLASSAQALSVAVAAIIGLDTLTLTGSAEGLTVTPGAVSTLLDTLNLAGSVVSLSVTPGAISVTLDTLSLVSTAEVLSVIQAGIVALDTLSLNSSAVSLTIQAGAVSTALDTLQLVSAVQALSVLTGAQVALDTLSLASSAVSLTVTPGAVSTTLDTLELAASAESLSIAALVSVALDTLSLAASVDSLTVTPGAVTTLLDSLSLTSSIPPLAVQPGAVSLPLDTLSLAASVEDLDVSIGSAVQLATLSLASSVDDLTVTPGGTTVSLDTLTLASQIIVLTVVAIIASNRLEVSVSDSSAFNLAISDGAGLNLTASDVITLALTLAVSDSSAFNLAASDSDPFNLAISDTED